jgi:hypothetical protein
MAAAQAKEFAVNPDIKSTIKEIAMQTIRVLEKTDKHGMLQLRIPLGKPDMEHDIVLVVQPKEASDKPKSPEELGWPPGYFDLAGSIDDETITRPPQGEMPKPVEFD